MSRVKNIARKILPWFGYWCLFWMAFLFFAYLTFPYGRVRDYLVQEIERPKDRAGRRQPSGLELEIVDLSPSWVTGIEATGVRLVQYSDDPEAPPVEMMFESVEARVSLLSLLVGNLTVSYTAELAGGAIEGDYADADGAMHVTANIQGLHLRRIGLIRGALGIPVTGTASGHIDMNIADQVRETAGQIELDIADLRLGDGHAKLALPGMGDGLTIDQVQAGNLALRVNAENGVAHVERLTAHGPDAEIDANGSVQLLRPLAMSRLDMLFRLKFLDAYREKSDRTRALFSLLELNPRLRPARTDDGALQYRIEGSLGSHITPTPARSSPAPGSGAGSRPQRRPNGGSNSDEE